MFKKSYLILMLAISMLLMLAVPALAATQNVTFTVAQAIGISTSGDVTYETVNQNSTNPISKTAPTDYFFEITGGDAADVTVKADTSGTNWTLVESGTTVLDDEIALTYGTTTIQSPLFTDDVAETNIKTSNDTSIKGTNTNVPFGKYGGDMKLYVGTAVAATTGSSQTIILTWTATLP